GPGRPCSPCFSLITARKHGGWLCSGAISSENGFGLNGFHEINSHANSKINREIICAYQGNNFPCYGPEQGNNRRRRRVNRARMSSLTLEAHVPLALRRLLAMARIFAVSGPAGMNPVVRRLREAEVAGHSGAGPAAAVGRNRSHRR